MIDILLKFTQKAGRKLKSMRKNVKTMGNKDSSVSSLVTQADVYISDIFAKTVKKHFSHLSYMIIDEEKITNYGKDKVSKAQEKINQAQENKEKKIIHKRRQNFV